MGLFDIYETTVIQPFKFNDSVSFEFKNALKYNDIDYSAFISIDEIFSFINLKQQYHTMDELIVDIGKIDMRILFKETIDLNTYFKCPFVFNSLGWFSANASNKIRYFSKYNESIVFLDTLDVLQFLLKAKDISTTLNILIKEFDIEFIADSWLSYQRLKYKNNMKFIHSITTEPDIKNKYPALTTLLLPCLKVYESLNVIGNTHLGKKDYVYKGHNIFFVSNNYLSTFNNLHQSTINRIINLLCCLGLISKIPKSELMDELIDTSQKIAKRNNVKDTISYYYISSFEDICEIAEPIAIDLYYNDINVSNISEKSLLSIFPKSFVKKIFLRESSKSKPTSIDINYDFMISFIKNTIDNQGYCTKSQLENRLKRDFEKNISWRTLRDKLINLCELNNISYSKPTKELKIKYNLQTSEYIFFNLI